MIDYKALAYQIAQNAFKDKVDKVGKPYFHHLARVANNFKDDDFLYTIAILHDLLEDCPEWNIKALGCIFPENIARTINLLTRKKGQDYFEYINQINENSWATRIKLVDLKDNMDITRLESISDKDLERLNKYLKAHKILTQKR